VRTEGSSEAPVALGRRSKHIVQAHQVALGRYLAARDHAAIVDASQDPGLEWDRRELKTLSVRLLLRQRRAPKLADDLCKRCVTNAVQR